MKQSNVCPNKKCAGHDVVCTRYNIVLGDIMGYNDLPCYSCMVTDLQKIADLIDFWERIHYVLKNGDCSCRKQERIEGVEKVLSDLHNDIECIRKRMKKIKVD